MLVQLVAVHRAPQRRELGDLVADDEQLELFELARAQLGERFDQPHEVLVRLDRSRVQHEAVIELEALAHARDVLGVRLDPEPLVNRVVDDRDLVRRHVEEVQDVALGRLRHREDPIRLRRGAPHRRARVGVRRAVRQVLRKHQVDAVVNGHDRSAADRDRQHVVRRVKHVRLSRASAPTARGTARGASSWPTARGPSGSWTELLGHAHVGLVAEQHVLVLAIDAREVPQEVPDVGADAEVVQLPGIDRDFHRWNDDRELSIPTIPVEAILAPQVSDRPGIDAAAARDLRRLVHRVADLERVALDRVEPPGAIVGGGRRQPHPVGFVEREPGAGRAGSGPRSRRRGVRPSPRRRRSDRRCVDAQSNTFSS